MIYRNKLLQTPENRCKSPAWALDSEVRCQMSKITFFISFFSLRGQLSLEVFIQNVYINYYARLEIVKCENEKM